MMIPDLLTLRRLDGRLSLAEGTTVPGKGQARAWTLAFADDARIEQACFELLSTDERERAGRFAAANAYRHFVQARAALRLLLGQCLDRAPEALAFDYGAYGKPVLKEGGRLHFNIAHSGGYALLALADGVDVGADIEQCRLTSDMDALAAMVFSACEHEAWLSLAPQARMRAFFESWTAKEAVVKAVGRGLGLGLPEVELGAPMEGAPDDEFRMKAAGLGECRVFRVQAPEGYAAALALWGQGSTMGSDPVRGPTP
ncbi:4'-phosphopantetheinyl transferase superfamily protein [Alcaligenaceae bacterium]|nr:4'-phosphopantetheinyl transferase superfamily protein [Alcaligenaceae bacterium]